MVHRQNRRFAVAIARLDGLDLVREFVTFQKVDKILVTHQNGSSVAADFSASNSAIFLMTASVA